MTEKACTQLFGVRWQGSNRGKALFCAALSALSYGLQRCLAGAICFAGFLLPAETVTWTLTNHAGHYSNELVRLKVILKPPFDANRLVVTEDGLEVPAQVEIRKGTRTAVDEGDVWVCTSIAGKASHEYVVTTGATPRKFPPLVQMERQGADVVLDNGLVAVKIPFLSAAAEAPGPITALRRADGPWLGGSSWKTDLQPARFTAETVGDGTLFAKIKLRYEFVAGRGLREAGTTAPFAEFFISLAPGQPLVAIEESHAMNEGDAWLFETTRGWNTKRALFAHSARPPTEGDLKPCRVLPDNTLMFLQPRWTQSTNHQWFFAAADEVALVGAIVARAGRWDWPFDNVIAVQGRLAGDAATLVCPTFKGRRYFWLMAGPRGLAASVPELVKRVAIQPLDKLANEYLLDWPGLAPGGFQGFFWLDNAINPTDGIRRQGGSLIQKYRGGSVTPDRGLLARFQIFLDPDAYGYYWNHWGPINPNFATDLLRVPIGMVGGLKGHPDFKRFAKMAEAALRMDLDFAVTLPGGAGQECPGYTAHALTRWLEEADLCKDQLGFDSREWPRFKAAASFLLHTSPPLGGGKRGILPIGDTHPPGPDVLALAETCGVRESIADFTTEELPGFGAIFRSHSGQPEENFLSFKAGPNRGHYHGDQLSFHYCGNGRRLAIDHMCSYAPRADQEHLHNRLAFSAGDWEFANLDGYERLIAFRTSPEVDVAVGQVESWRLRRQPRTPQETTWNYRGPYQALSEPLTYRRTVAFVKHRSPQSQANGPLDYFVILDQVWGPPVKATYCLHVESPECQADGPFFRFGAMTLFCAEPQKFQFERFDWSFKKPSKADDGYGESTCGVRLHHPLAVAAVASPVKAPPPNAISGAHGLTTAAPGRTLAQTSSKPEVRFVTVLYPARNAPRMEAMANGVRVSFAGGLADEVVFSDLQTDPGAPLVTLRRSERVVTALKSGDLDLNRSQGDVGLFIPECGYDFGPIPDWLIRQRDGKLSDVRLNPK